VCSNTAILGVWIVDGFRDGDIVSIVVLATMLHKAGKARCDPAMEGMSRQCLLCRCTTRSRPLHSSATEVLPEVVSSP
jgi:hypothetical protein